MNGDARATRYRILVADDSALLRRMLVGALSSVAEIEVVGAAIHGREALEMFDKLAPDLVTLDVEMPELDGLLVLAEIRKRAPCVPVLMFSSRTSKGAETTLAALLAGASDFVHKPVASAGPESALAEIRAALVPKILALCESAARLPKTAIQPRPRLAELEALAPSVSDTSILLRSARLETSPIEVVAIGVSTGGPAALARLLPALGSDLRVPILIVQHMPPIYTRHLAESLARKCGFDVREASDGDELLPGQCRIAPGERHMLVERRMGRTRIALNQDAHENFCRPAVDVLFRSVAALYKSRALALVMTGMGQDGLAGARAVHEQGGTILAQDEASSVVWGMPGFVVREKLAERVLDPEGLAQEIRERTRPNPLARAG